MDDDGNGTFDRAEKYVYDGQDVVLAFDGTSSLANRYLHGPAVDQVFASEDDLGEILWGLSDHQSTVRDIADYDAGTDTTTIANHRQFDTFGNITSETDSNIDFLYSYTGRIYDADAELYYYRARWYDPGVGRFLSEDPSGFDAGDANLYRYVSNNPVNYTDPSGLQLSSPSITDPGWIGNSDPYYRELESIPWPNSLQRAGIGVQPDNMSQGFFSVVLEAHANHRTVLPDAVFTRESFHTTLDAAGVADPTPVSDGLNGIVYAFEGKWFDAGTSAVAMFPYLGDLAKAGKYGNKAINAVDAAGDLKDASRVYDVGRAKDMRRSPLNGTQVHHAPQSRQAESLIGDFNPRNKVGNEPAIRLPIEEHEAVSAAQRLRTAPASARDLLADEIRILRNNTNTPNSALQELIELNQKLHSYDYLPLHR